MRINEAAFDKAKDVLVSAYAYTTDQYTIDSGNLRSFLFAYLEALPSVSLDVYGNPLTAAMDAYMQSANKNNNIDVESVDSRDMRAAIKAYLEALPNTPKKISEATVKD